MLVRWPCHLPHFLTFFFLPGLPCPFFVPLRCLTSLCSSLLAGDTEVVIALFFFPFTRVCVSFFFCSVHARQAACTFPILSTSVRLTHPCPFFFPLPRSPDPTTVPLPRKITTHLTAHKTSRSRVSHALTRAPALPFPSPLTFLLLFLLPTWQRNSPTQAFAKGGVCPSTFYFLVAFIRPQTNRSRSGRPCLPDHVYTRSGGTRPPEKQISR